MSRLLLPDNRSTSATAVAGKGDVRSENLFSSLVMGHGGSTPQKVFTVPQGQAIPRLMGAGIAPTATHQLVHNELTTNFNKAGEAGSAFGDFTIKQINIHVEQAYYDGSGVLNTYGAGQQETMEILHKTYFQLKISGKKYIEGPTFMFPTLGGAHGAVSTTETGVTVSALTNGWPGAGRRLGKFPILVERTDSIEGVVGTGGTLAFSVTTGVGQSTLCWYNLDVVVRGDVR
jgi:hypothetical protein